jgi:hypothetical protein
MPLLSSFHQSFSKSQYEVFIFLYYIFQVLQLQLAVSCMQHASTTWLTTEIPLLIVFPILLHFVSLLQKIPFDRIL